MIVALAIASLGCSSTDPKHRPADTDDFIYRTYQVEPGAAYLVRSAESGAVARVRVGENEFQIRIGGNNEPWSEPASAGTEYTVQLGDVLARIRLGNDGKELQIGNDKPSPGAALVVAWGADL